MCRQLQALPKKDNARVTMDTFWGRILHSDKVKRGVDVVGAMTALSVFAPVMLGVAVIVRVKLGKPVLFRQVRRGYKEKLFTIYKFRTMTDARDGEGKLLPDSDRLPWLGRMLRKTSLDELPEFVNVLAGDMSLVGPRPLLPEYLERYTPEQARRHAVKPGVTGWSQVMGRNAMSWEEKFALDNWYVDNHDLWVDTKILAKTFGCVLAGTGVAQPGQATMPPFTGGSDAVESDEVSTPEKRG